MNFFKIRLLVLSIFVIFFAYAEPGVEDIITPDYYKCPSSPEAGSVLFGMFKREFPEPSEYIFLESLDYFKIIEGSDNKLNFYENAKFEGQPQYTIDKDGFKKKGSLICPWATFKADNKKGLNRFSFPIPFFEGGDKKCQDDFIKFVNVADNHIGSPTYCPVMEVKAVLQKDQKYDVKVKIADKEYFLDIRTYPRIINGRFISTPEKRKPIKPEYIEE